MGAWLAERDPLPYLLEETPRLDGFMPSATRRCHAGRRGLANWASLPDLRCLRRRSMCRAVLGPVAGRAEPEAV